MKRRNIPEHLGEQIVFRFNGDPKSDETVTDKRGSMRPWCIGDVFHKGGKRWRVEVVRRDLNMDRSKTPVQIQRVYLTDRDC
jgi:hypothetical protein